jgi:hypothetical protein
VNDVISKQRQDLWQTENQFTVLQEAAGRRQLTAQEKSLLAHKEETLEYKRQLADLGDKVASQQKLNQLADQAVKFEQQQKAARAGLQAQSEGVSTREAGRQTTCSVSAKAIRTTLRRSKRFWKSKGRRLRLKMPCAQTGWPVRNRAGPNIRIQRQTFSALFSRFRRLRSAGWRASLPA